MHREKLSLTRRNSEKYTNLSQQLIFQAFILSSFNIRPSMNNIFTICFATKDNLIECLRKYNWIMGSDWMERWKKNNDWKLYELIHWLLCRNQGRNKNSDSIELIFAVGLMIKAQHCATISIMVCERNFAILHASKYSFVHKAAKCIQIIAHNFCLPRIRVISWQQCDNYVCVQLLAIEMWNVEYSTYCNACKIPFFDVFWLCNLVSQLLDPSKRQRQWQRQHLSYCTTISCNIPFISIIAFGFPLLVMSFRVLSHREWKVYLMLWNASFPIAALNSFCVCIVTSERAMEHANENGSQWARIHLLLLLYDFMHKTNINKIFKLFSPYFVVLT